MLYVSTLLIVSVLLIILLSSKYKISTFFVLILVAILAGLAAGMNGETVIKALKTGFGETMGKVGLLIILGATLGILLDKSKATLSLANYILAKTGERYAPLAITIIGFVIGLPIFCDSGFIVLIGLTLSLGQKLPKERLTLVSCLATSLFGVHCLVPPHPGITAAASTLNVELGKAMLLGVFLAIPATVVAYFWSIFSSKKTTLTFDNQAIEKFEKQSTNLPSPFRSFLPIIVPIALIALKSVASLYPVADGFLKIIKFLGEPAAALLVGIGLAIPLFKRVQKAAINQIFEESIEKSGPILAVIAAGGAFGEIIKLLDLGKVYGALLQGQALGLLVPFVLAAILKTAQGSSTVAAISAASICAPLLPALGLDSEWGRLLALSSIGAGSMVVSHANDAYFWVIARFGGLDVSVTLRTFTPASFFMGITTLLTLYAVKWFVL
ncbi:MAG: GntP family permease [Cytophagia bacterium]|nr:MAG: GntP family permease [Runella sp.]TAG22230.1 MAG: GntP family permease [Cytophagales bacterium]TAG41319.1 MAG: GntP family permease [Cytophagia bacterium]TAG83001.1 MAG: GntP family permease [Cytophagales bacterium]